MNVGKLYVAAGLAFLAVGVVLLTDDAYAEGREDAATDAFRRQQLHDLEEQIAKLQPQPAVTP